ncbi:MAG: flavin reductase family protein [Pseudomonadales bacterium]|nr:flavin reductase family protein [Pseudomonadales bacterium]
MEFDTKQMRDALGQFVTGVTVVTVLPAKIGGAKEQSAPLGITVNSFASVSLDPPLVLWSLQKTSETLSTFNSTNAFAVNILASDAQDISNRYAQHDNHELESQHYDLSAEGVPLLAGCKVSFVCETEQRVDGGDHVIYIARVKSISAIDPAPPLVFFSGSYGALAV